MNLYIYNLLKKNNTNDLIKIILNYSNQKRINILYFDEITDTFINRFNSRYQFVNKCLVKDEIIKYMKDEHINGMCDSTNIYIKKDMSTRVKLATICHEFIHLIRNAYNKYNREKDIFREEYIADIAYHMVYYNIDISNIWKHTIKISNNIIKSYKIKKNISSIEIISYTHEFINHYKKLKIKFI